MGAPATRHELFPDPPPELENLFREHHDRSFRAAYRITGSAMDAEDVLQTIFLRLMKRERVPDLSPSPESYFHRAAVNAALDLMRSPIRARSASLEDVETTRLESPGLDPESQHADRELKTFIRRSVARLGRRAAEVFALRYFEGYGNREIAAMLNTSQMVVAVILHRSRSRLRKDISRYLETKES